MSGRLSPAILASLAVLVGLILAPFLLNLLLPANQAQFWTANILGRSLVFGIIAMSLTFLATYGGFISLAQMTVAGIAGTRSPSSCRARCRASRAASPTRRPSRSPCWWRRSPAC